MPKRCLELIDWSVTGLREIAVEVGASALLVFKLRSCFGVIRRDRGAWCIIGIAHGGLGKERPGTDLVICFGSNFQSECPNLRRERRRDKTLRGGQVWYVSSI